MRRVLQYWPLMAAGGALAFVAACSRNAEKNMKFLALDARDTMTSPGESFYKYANGTWIKNTRIPGDNTGWGSFITLDEENNLKLKKILEGAASHGGRKGSAEQQLGDFFHSAMDSVAIDKAGLNPIAEDLKRIDGISDLAGLERELAEQAKSGSRTLLSYYVGPDDRDVSINRLQFFQGGTMLPSKDYYFEQDSGSRAIRQKFVSYMKDILVAAGDKASDAEKSAMDIMALQTAMAATQRNPVELRDPQRNYNKFAVSDLQKLAPNIHWNNFLLATGMRADTVLVGQPDYYKGLSALFKSTSIETWKKYMRLRTIASAPLGKPFEDINFDFFGKTMNGQKVQKVRWKRAVETIDGSAGELLGQLFVKEYFPEDSKKRMLELVDNLQKVYAKRIKELSWMSPVTKEKALGKLNAFVKKIGYPDKWKDYSKVEISRDYAQNLKNLARFEQARETAKIGKKVDRTEWLMSPPTVNAYYNPPFNEIVFPAGILQPPFFYGEADDAINYGAIGAVIGHEMTHGFDDQGRQYDAHGNLADWWTAEDATKFNALTKRVVDQYAGYTVFDKHVNGELTLGENLADIGGLMIAYEAFKNTEQGKGDKKIDGLTPDQRFFLSFAAVWRVTRTDESMRQRLKTDPHSPSEFRVNGPTSLMPEFYKAFSIKAGDKMYKAEKDRVKVW